MRKGKGWANAEPTYVLQEENKELLEGLFILVPSVALLLTYPRGIF